MTCPMRSAAVRLTGYFPDGSAMEGGFNDAHMNELQTLQAYIEGWHYEATGRYGNGDIIAMKRVGGRADHISVAADPTFGMWWMCIPTLEKHYGMSLPFRIVDTGGAFKGAGYSHLDICCTTRQDTMEAFMTEQLHPVVFLQLSDSVKAA